MTEKEFENLKVGDKVWTISDWYSVDFRPYHMEVECLDFVGKTIIAKCEFGSGFCLAVSNCHLTKSEAWEAKIKESEDWIKDKEEDLGKEKKILETFKAELAKAKEEEGTYCWITDSGEVRKVRSDCYRGFQKYPTEQEAYEALAEHYKRKLFKTLEKCGYKFAICYDKYIAVVKIDKEKDEFLWCYYYPERSYGSVRKTNVFDTLEEAEAELERRKRND